MILDTLRRKLSATSLISSGDSSPAQPSEPSQRAEELLQAHKESLSDDRRNGASKKRGRPRSSRPAAAPVDPQPSGYLPPQTSLSEVMAGATGLFYSIHAALSDDEDWLVADTVKKEMGNVLSWMLADDFYKMGGIGKYVTGGILFMGVYAIQAVKAGAKRRARKQAAKLAAASSQHGQGPKPNTSSNGVKHEAPTSRPVEGFVAGPTPNPPTV